MILSRTLHSFRMAATFKQLAFSQELQVTGLGGIRRLSQGVPPTSDEDSHDDFKPQFKKAASSTVIEQIEEDIKSNKLMVFMKGYPEAPMCGFSMFVCRVLDAYGAKYGARNVLEDPELRQAIKDYSAWPTIPQVFLDGEFLGGCDIIKQLADSGELDEMLKKSGAVM